MNILKLRISLIAIGFVIFVYGAYITNNALNSIPQNLPYQKELEKLATSTDYTVGVLIFTAGGFIVVLGVFWKQISSKIKS